MPKFVCKKGVNEGDEFPVTDGITGIGRSNVCNVVLYDGRCSRLHCNVHKRDRDYFIEDLGSANGTFLNGKRLTRGELVELKSGHQVRLGDSQLEFCRGEAEVQAKKKVVKRTETSEISQTLPGDGSVKRVVNPVRPPTFLETLRRLFGR